MPVKRIGSFGSTRRILVLSGLICGGSEFTPAVVLDE